MLYELAVERLRSYCHLLSEDYDRKSWYGKIFTEILTIQTQLNADTPDVNIIISSVEDIQTLVKTEHGKAFKESFGKKLNHPENILEVIATIGEHFTSIFNAMQKGPGKKQIQIRSMASLLRRLRQCA